MLMTDAPSLEEAHNSNILSSRIGLYGSVDQDM